MKIWLFELDVRFTADDLQARRELGCIERGGSIAGQVEQQLLQLVLGQIQTHRHTGALGARLIDRVASLA